jgi:Relaxase/Mobilisation nuclease domain
VIGKITKATRATVRSVLDKERAERLGIGIQARDRRGVERQLATVEATRPGLADKRRHFMLSLAPGERLTTEQWGQVVEWYMSRMGYGDAPYVAARHHDQPHDHVHVVASRIRYDGQVVKVWRERVRSREAMREIEREYGLRQTAPAFDPRRNSARSPKP